MIHVTEPLQKYQDFSGIDPEVLEKAAYRGTYVHWWCSAYASRIPMLTEPPEDVKLYFQSFRRWFDAYVCEVFCVEHQFESKIWGVVGTPDLIVSVHGDEFPMVVDLKTPATESKTWKCQLAMYVCLAVENGIPANRYAALMLDKNGSLPKLREYRDHNRDLSVYLQALSVHRYFKE